MAQKVIDSYPEFGPAPRGAWRKWLSKHHDKYDGVWLVLARKESGLPFLPVAEAVEEALCFGWIDSTARKVDDRCYKMLVARRKPKSKWSKINKARVKKLIEQDLMMPAGMAMVNLAKRTGTWTAMNKVERLEVPDDLKEALGKNKKALGYFEAFPPSAKKMILGWIADAKREETRTKRIAQVVSLAEQNIRANQPNAKAGKTAK